MSDSRSAYDEQLPWLEAVDDEDGPRGVPARSMFAALLVVLLAAALVSATFFWLGRQNSADTGGTPELIRAEPGPYKVKPDDPGGLDVAGESETAFQTSAGQDTDAQLDLSRLPEQPVAAPPKPVAEPKPAETPKPVQAEPAPRAADRRQGQRDPARRVRQPCAGRTRMDRFVGALPDGGRDEQARSFPSRAVSGSGLRLRRLRKPSRRARRSRSPARIASWRTDAGSDLRTSGDGDHAGGARLLPRRGPGRLHPVPPQLRKPRADAADDRWLRDIAGRAEVPILIDQEGGRVARMRPPEWPAFPVRRGVRPLYQLAPSSRDRSGAGQRPRAGADAQ